MKIGISKDMGALSENNWTAENVRNRPTEEESYSWAIPRPVPSLRVASPDDDPPTNRASEIQLKRASIPGHTPKRSHAGEDDRSHRSPRRSLGAVWRVPSSSPVRQFGLWLGRRPRSYAEDMGGETLTPNVSSSIPQNSSLSAALFSSTLTAYSPTQSGGSSPDSQSLLFPWQTVASPLTSPPTPVTPSRPTHLIIKGIVRSRSRRLSQSPIVSRLCNVTVTRLQVLQPLGADLNSVTLAVKMQSSKRTLRSNEIPLQQNGLLDTELQLTFSLQYPHFLKRDGNTLQIMLQKRKKYKNRTFLGCKTVAVGLVNMTQVLQRPVDRDLDLYIEGKEKVSAVARVNLVSLSSQPVDTDETGDRTKQFIPDNHDRVADLDDTDEDEDYSSADDGSDSEPILDLGPTHHRLELRPPTRHRFHHHQHPFRSNSRSKSLPPNARQRNLKQRFIALLKRFKVPEALQAFDQDQDLDPRPDAEVDEAEIEDLFNELEDLSDSGPEIDTLSITSTPKPSLRPFFSSSRSLLNDGLSVPAGVQSSEKFGVDRMSDESSKRADSDHMETWTDQEQSDTPCIASSPPKDDKVVDKNKSVNKAKLFNRDKSNISLKEKRSSSASSTPRQEKTVVERTDSIKTVDVQPRKVLLEHLARLLPLEDDLLPDHIILVNTMESHGSLLAAYLTERGHRVINTMAPADVKATISHLVNKLQKFCNSNAKAPGPMKVVIIGSDTYINCVLRPYVEQFSFKPPDFQNHFRFLSIPLAGVNSLAKYLASIDSIYGATFASDSWKEVIEKWEKPDVQEAVNRIQRYLSQAQCTLNLPIAEAMLTYKEKSNDDESCQAFVPFVTDVRLGSGDVTSTSVDLEDPAVSPPSSYSLPSSPPAVSNQSVGSNNDKPKESTTPPSSPNIGTSHTKSVTDGATDKEPLDLQVDYWVLRGSNREDKDKDKDKEKAKLDGGKYTVKGIFRTLQVARLSPLGISLPQDPNAPVTHLTFSYATKEKKQRIMRLGKKKERERESESRREVVDGICRLLASTRNQPLKVTIDSVEWTNVKFFQISSQWQTQIKTFPIALFSLQDSGGSL